MFPEFLRDDVFRLETQRLWLRWPTAADAAVIVRLEADHGGQWINALPHNFAQDANGFVNANGFVMAAREANLGGGSLHLALALKQRPGSLVGILSLSPQAQSDEDAPVSGLLGYWLGQPYWGGGITCEAINALLDFVWLATDFAVIHADALADKPASHRVLEKSGFSPAGNSPPARKRYAFFRPRPRFRAQDGVQAQAMLS